MKILNTANIDFNQEFIKILNRANLDIGNVEEIVKDILSEVKQNGFEAIKKHIKKFDNWEVESFEDLFVKKETIQKAYQNLDDDIKNALHLAYDRIKSYHQKQLPKSWLDFEENGTILGQKITPVQRAGLYIPGGKAVYPSSLLMNAIPAIVAGVKDIIVTTPTPNNQINELLLAACYLCNIDNVIKVGGASAIALLAYGIDNFKKVDVVTGPGNIFVATAKKLVYGEVNIDMIAGPSEIGIIADESANAKYIAIDLLSQAEHDEMASSILITNSSKLANEVDFYIKDYLKQLPREKIASKSINERGVIIITKNIDEAITLMNEIAPEHLEVMTQNPFELLPKIKNAGAIFLGENTPEAIGDYIAGPNHTLPTGSTAKFYSPLSVENFLKKSSIISFSKQAITQIGENATKIADIEGLQAHALSIRERL